MPANSARGTALERVDRGLKSPTTKRRLNLGNLTPVVVSRGTLGDHRGVSQRPETGSPTVSEAPATTQREPRKVSARAYPSADLAALNVLKRILLQRKGLFFGNLGLRLVKELIPFASPILVGIAVDLLSGKNKSLLFLDLLTNNVRSILIVAGAMALLAVAKTALGYWHTIVSAHLGRHVVETARREIAEASMEMALDERRRFNSGDLLDRSLSDTKGLRSFTQNVVVRIITNTVRVIVPLYYMFSNDVVMALVVLAVIPLQSGFSGLLQRRLRQQTRNARARESEHTSVVKEAIDGWNSVASVGSQSWMTTELRQTAAASEDAKIIKKQTTASIAAVINMCTALGIAACYGIGGWRIINNGALDPSTTTADAFTVGTLIAFIGIAKKVYSPFQAYTKIVSSYRTGLVNLERIAEVLNAPSIDPRSSGPELAITGGEIALHDVSFTYNGADQPTLDHMSGSIPGHSLTVITGSSGSGKTTLLRLLMGHDKPDSGTVSIDGQDINLARLSSVRSAMALVPQEPMLFTGTLGENLTLGHSGAATEDLLDACHKAGLLEMVRELPLGLDTEVGSGRHMLSGGQLRRMAIARALLRKPGILLLDEPTAGLDKLHSEQVLETLRRISRQTTVVMVSHRSNPLSKSDHHLILNGGGWSRGVAGKDASATGDEHANDASHANDTIVLDDPSGAPASANGSAMSNGSVNGNGAAHTDTPSNGHAPTPVKGHAAVPRAATSQPIHRALGMSGMGRPITANCIDRRGASSRVMILNGHRSETLLADGVTSKVLASLTDEPEVNVALCVIDNVNPDRAWTSDQRTILGIDPSEDHHQRRSVETALLHQSIFDWRPDLIVDLGREQDSSDQGDHADVRINIRYPDDRTVHTAAWLNQLAQDIKRRLSVSRFTFTIEAEVCAATSLTAARNVPVIELSSIEPPNSDLDGRALEALTEASVAIYRSAGLSHPVLTNA